MQQPPVPTDAVFDRHESELEALLDAAIDAIIVIDQRGRIETFNRSAERLFGYQATEVSGQPVNVLMPEPYRSQHDRYLGAYMDTGRAKIIGIGREVYAQRADGTTFPASLAVGEIKGSIPKRFVGFIQDITARKAAIEELQRERDRVHNYLELAQVILVALDRDGRIALINRKGCEILDSSENELIGRDWFQHCVPERHRAGLRQLFNAVLTETEVPPAYAEDTVLRRDGSTVLMAWRSALLRDEQGRPTGLLSSGEDITDRRHAEEALRRSETLLTTAQQIAGLGNYEIRLSTGAIFWSRQLFDLLGYDASAPALDMPELIEQRVHPDDRERVSTAWASMLTRGDRLDIEHRIRRPDGGIRFVHSQAEIQRVEYDGQVITGTLHDITTRKQSEEELRINQEKLAHVARLSTMGEMATGLAHEINQPLTAIATYAQAAIRLMQADPTAHTDDVREALGHIATQALRAGDVIRRLRTFVKNRSSRAETLDPNQLIEDILTLAETDARASDVRLSLEITPHLPAVSADPIQIQQVMLNLIRNAIDATVDSPSHSREIVLQSSIVGNDIEMAVIDHGPGVPSPLSEDIFNPFVTTKESGTGLGLPISRSIIRAHGGRLGHRATAGGGATFYFTLPALPGGITA